MLLNLKDILIAFYLQVGQQLREMSGEHFVKFMNEINSHISLLKYY